ncbi:MAG: HNH endonuclease [Sphingobacteriales bacterium]|nr:HNH endonuclease [Sphingobacteriales bacterium]
MKRMAAFRGKCPVRRAAPNRNPTVNWALHKADLREDFNNHCGYCDSYDGYAHTYFEVDHFVPKDLIVKNRWPITLVQYSNLVYACKFCNNNKLANWPSNSYTVFHIGNKGFIDPCNKKYSTHFYRRNNGEIMWNTRLGKWMYFNAFKFDERNPGIKLLWNLNRLRKALDKLYEARKKNIKTSKKFKSIQAEINKISAQYYPAHTKLMEYYRNL